MTTKDGKQSITIKQADREHAADSFAMVENKRPILEGKIDIHPTVIACANSRQDIITRLAEPDDAMIEAAAKGICKGSKSDMFGGEDGEVMECTCDDVGGGTCLAVDMYGAEAKAALTAAANVLEG